MRLTLISAFFLPPLLAVGCVTPSGTDDDAAAARRPTTEEAVSGPVVDAEGPGAVVRRVHPCRAAATANSLRGETATSALIGIAQPLEPEAAAHVYTETSCP